MLPESGKRKLAATVLFTALAFIGGGGLVYLEKISGDNYVSLIWATSVVVVAFIGGNVVNAFGGGKK